MNPLQNQLSTTQAPSEEKVIEYIQGTYKGQSTAQVKKYEESILMLMNNSPSLIQWMFKCIESEHGDYQFKQACMNLIKNHYYAISQTSSDKSMHIRAASHYLQMHGVKVSLKETLAIALEHILNHDQHNEYRANFISQLFNKLTKLSGLGVQEWSFGTLDFMWALMAEAIVFMNSVVEIQDLAKYMSIMLPHVASVASLALVFIQRVPMREHNVDQLFFPCIKAFELIQIGFQRLSDEEEFIQEQYHSLLNTQYLHSLIFSYLNILKNEGSIITSFKNVNILKQSILEFIFNVYRTKQTPEGYLEMLLATFVIQSSKKTKKVQLDEQCHEPEQILCRCMQIMENHLRFKFRYELFLKYKVEILFSLLMCCRTTQEEEELLLNEPEKFVELAEDFSSAVSQSNNIKIRAACFIKAFVNNIDEGKRNIVELALVFVSGSFALNSKKLMDIPKEFQSFEFSNLQPRERIDIFLMVLALISSEVEGNLESFNTVQLLIMLHREIFMGMSDKLLLMRLVHMIGYFPNTIFFPFIKDLMQKDRAFFAQGLWTFTKIGRNQAFVNTFPLTHNIFVQLLQLIDVSDLLFEDLLELNYKAMLKGNNLLFEKVIEKLWKTYFENIQVGGSVQKSIICMNNIEKLIENETKPHDEKKLQDIVAMMDQYGCKIQILEENFISLYLAILSKYIYVPPIVTNFIQRTCLKQKVQKLGKNTKLFILVNRFIMKYDKNDIIPDIYKQLFQFLNLAAEKIDLQDYNFSMIPQVCFTIGNIILITTNFSFSQETIVKLLDVADKFQDHNRAWVTILFLHYLHRHPKIAIEYFINLGKLESILQFILRLEFHSLLERKIVVLCLSDFISENLPIKLIVQIIKFCAGLLLTQHSIYKQKPEKKTRHQKMNAKLRRMLVFDEPVDKSMKMESCEDIDTDDPNTLENNNEFIRFKHPFSNVDQFLKFKKIVQGEKEKIRYFLDEHDLERLREVMSIEWKKNHTRKIVKIGSITQRVQLSDEIAQQ